MKSYTAEFRTDADYATHDFKARSPQHALKKARAFYDKRTEELMFQGYDGGHPVNEIEVHDAEGDQVALWQDDELRVRLAAHDLLDAAELALRELRGFSSDSESEAVRVLLAAIAKAKGDGTDRAHRRRPLPPDPETMNGERAEWAAVALRHFQCVTGSDYEDSLGDLLGNLMHWADRSNFDFDAALCRARGHYAAETAGKQP
jgi:hypothetical protein